MAFWSKFKKNSQDDDPLLKREPGMAAPPQPGAATSAGHAPEPGFGYQATPANQPPASSYPTAGARASQVPPSSPTTPTAAPHPMQAPQGYGQVPPPPPPQATQPNQAPPVRPVEEAPAAPPFVTHRDRERPVPSFSRRAMEKTPPRGPNPMKSNRSVEASEQIANADLEYKHLRRIKARRRFVGATMLLALVLVILPFIFDKEPPPADQTVPLTIPKADSVDIAKIVVPGTPPQAMPEDDQEPIMEETPAPTEPKAEAPKAPEPPKEAKPEQKTEVAKNEPPPEPPRTGSGQYFIQLLATRDQNKAESIRRTMNDSGIPCYLEKVAVQGGNAWRVRVGPFTTAKLAEEARAQVGLLGYSAKVQTVK